MSESRKKKLLAQGFTSIRELPDTEKLTPMQTRIREAHVSGRPFLDPKFRKKLSTLPRPLHYLDFETAAPAAPLYTGDHPYDLVPFQWSLHLEDDDLTHPNRLSHRSYLADGQSDPRLGFAKTLAESVQPQGAILTYTNYERQVLLALAGRLPLYAPSLVALAERCVDLCALVRRFLYHPGFGQSFSLKNVLPALAPDLAYRHLDIGEGMMAGRAFLNLVMEKDAQRRSHIRRALLEYCGRDTLAMVVIKRYVLGEFPPTDHDVNLV
jgi:predicted RecB family nuclease